MGTQVVNLIIGIIFGASLVLAGFSEPDKIIKALRLKEIHIIRTILVILIVAIIGTWLVSLVSTIEIENKSAAIVTLVIGGLIFGAGVGLTGYTPGTSFAGAASGKIDAILAIAGMFFGAYVFVFLYPPAIKPLEIIYNYGKVTLPEITHINKLVWVAFFSIVGMIALFLTLVLQFVKKSPDTKDGSSYSNEEILDKDLSDNLITEAGHQFQADSFETAQTLRLWKNLLFCIIFICMILIQIIFWLVNHNNNNSFSLIYDLTPNHISIILNIINILLILSAAFYVLTIFFCLSISFEANPGGLKYISQAFFSALVVIVLLCPWQVLLGRTLFGVIYTPLELYFNKGTNSGYIFSAVIVYLRFVGYWAFVILILIRSQIYSSKWSNALMERLKNIIQTR